MKNLIKSNIKKLNLVQLMRLINIEENNINKVLEKLDIHPNLTLSYNSSDFETIEFLDNKYKVEANFLCTYGTSSVLPTFYTEELIEYRNKDIDVLREFYNIFNKRQYQLLGEILIKNRLMLGISEFKDKNSLNYINSYIGLELNDKNNINIVNKFKLLKYINILNQKNKSLNMFETFLSDVLNISVKVIEYIKTKVDIPIYQKNSLRKMNTKIGDLYIGKKIKTLNGIKIVIENSEEVLRSFFPKEKYFYLMIEAINLFFSNNAPTYVIEYKNYEIESILNKQLVLKKKEIRLGMNSHINKKQSSYIYSCKNITIF